MRSSEKTYEKVAENCSSYMPKKNGKNRTSNSASSHERTCTNCRHFNMTGEYCELDLYDQIVKEHDFTN